MRGIQYIIEEERAELIDRIAFAIVTPIEILKVDETLSLIPKISNAHGKNYKKETMYYLKDDSDGNRWLLTEFIFEYPKATLVVKTFTVLVLFNVSELLDANKEKETRNVYISFTTAEIGDKLLDFFGKSVEKIDISKKNFYTRKDGTEMTFASYVKTYFKPKEFVFSSSLKQKAEKHG